MHNASFPLLLCLLLLDAIDLLRLSRIPFCVNFYFSLNSYKFYTNTVKLLFATFFTLRRVWEYILCAFHMEMHFQTRVSWPFLYVARALSTYSISCIVRNQWLLCHVCWLPQPILIQQSFQLKRRINFSVWEIQHCCKPGQYDPVSNGMTSVHVFCVVFRFRSIPWNKNATNWRSF